MKKIALFSIFTLFSCAILFSQTNTTASNEGAESLQVSSSETSSLISETNSGAASLKPTPQLALSTSEYMVTAGDVYSLSFAAGATPVNYSIPVDSSYKIRIANLAVINAGGKSFSQLKAQVEDIVTKNYPMSGVQFILVTPAVFKVTIEGEVRQTEIREAWALTRLSTAIRGTFTAYSSNRDVVVQSANGRKRTYDLFQASRFGDLSQDPYLRPDDKIIISKIKRKVTIAGSVKRPGTYELMKDENLSNLIDYYGDGLTDTADLSRITLSRYMEGEQGDSGKVIYLEKGDIEKNFELYNHDVINISSLQATRHYMTVEGIISFPASDEGFKESDSNPNTIHKRTLTFLPGTNYANFIRTYKNIFNNFSDLKNIYIDRGETRLNIDAEKIIYDETFKSEYFVEDYDIMHVPYQQSYNRIYVTGEVTESFERDAWPMVRLSTILYNDVQQDAEESSGNIKQVRRVLTSYSSTRSVQVTSIDGVVTTYDLFKAQRFGDLSQNPYIKAGETVTVQRLDRRVTINGAVERPGTYQLLEDDNLQKLIDYYGGGLTDYADTSRIELVRYNANDISNQALYLDQKSIDADFKLQNYDRVHISVSTDLLPVMFIEGAVTSDSTEGAATQAAENSKVSIRFNPDTNYAYLVRQYTRLFGLNSDLDNAFIIRGDKQIPINLTRMLYDRSFYSTETVQANDTLMVPFKQNFISVAGAVRNPGRYPYIPGRDWEYYVGLAGGFDRSMNTGQAITIVDMDGKKMKKTDPILPETTITAETNSFTYHFSKYAPVVTTILSLVSSVISIIAITTR